MCAGRRKTKEIPLILSWSKYFQENFIFCAKSLKEKLDLVEGNEKQIVFRLPNIKQKHHLSKAHGKCLAFIMVPPSKGDCPLLQGNLRNSAHYWDALSSSDAGFKCLFCWKGEGREGWRSRAWSQGSPGPFPMPLPQTPKPVITLEHLLNNKSEEKSFEDFSASKKYIFLSWMIPIITLTFYFSYSVEIVSMAKLNCAIPLIYKTCFSLCLVPLETWVVSACLNFTLPPSTSIQTWLLSKVTSMHWRFSIWTGHFNCIHLESK